MALREFLTQRDTTTPVRRSPLRSFLGITKEEGAERPQIDLGTDLFRTRTTTPQAIIRPPKTPVTFKEFLTEVPGAIIEVREKVKSFIAPSREQTVEEIQEKRKQTLLPEEVTKLAIEREGQFGQVRGPSGHLIDVFGGVGGLINRVALSKQLLKIKNPKTILFTLIKAGVPGDVARAYAPAFAKANEKKLVEAGLKSLQDILKTRFIKAPPSAQKIIGIEPAPFIQTRKRETTLLKERIKAIQNSARSEANKKAATQKLRSQFEEKIKKITREGGLKTLRIGIEQRIKGIARGVREGAVATRTQVKAVQQELEDIARTFKMEKEFFRKVKNIQTPEQLRAKMPEIEEIISRVLEAREVSVLKKQLAKELSGIKTKSVSSIPRGKFTIETQKTLNQIKEVSKLDRETALTRASELAEKHAGDITPEVAREMDVLRMAGGVKEMNGTELRVALENVKTLKTEGGTLNELRAFNRQEEVSRITNSTVDALGGRVDSKTAAIGLEEPFTGVKGIVRTVDNWLQGVDTLLDKLSVFDKTNTGRLDGFLNKKLGEMVHLSRQAQNKGLREWTEVIKENFARIFEVEGRQAAKIVNANKTPSVKFKVGNVSRNLSPNQIYKKWMEIQDPTLRETFEKGMGWGDEQFKFIDDYMNTHPKLKEWAKWQLEEFYPEYGRTVAPIYEARFSTPFSVRLNYSPIRRSTVEIYLDTEKSLLDNAFHMASDIPGSLKTRVKNLHPLEFVDGDQALTSHFIQMEHFKAFEETVRIWRNVFSNPAVRASIKEKHGSDILRNVNHLIDNIARDGLDASSSVSFLDTLRGNFTRAVLGVNPTVTLKQLASIPAYITEMPGGATKGIADFFKYQADFWRHPLENTRILMSSEMMKSRYRNMERDIKQLMNQKMPEKVLAGKESFLNRLMITVRMGDRGAILQGGWAIYKSNLDDVLRRGLSKTEAHAEALRKFERVTIRTQQAGEIENLSRLQTTGGSFGKLFTMFITAPNQYYRIASRSLRNLRYGVGDTASNIRNLMIAWVVLPSAFQFVSDGFRFDPKRQARATILGPLNGIPIIGENIEEVIRAFTGDDVFPSKGPPPFTISGKLATALRRAIQEIKNEDFSSEDVWKLIDDMAVVGGQFTGVPVDPTLRIIKGSESFITGKTDDLRRIIFSEFALDGEKKKSGLPELPKLPKLPKLPELPVLP